MFPPFGRVVAKQHIGPSPLIMSRVYVGTLDPNVTKEQLEDEARAFGKVEDIWIARNPPGFAFITY